MSVTCATVIGDCLANLLECRGLTVTRLNHVGDWGTQFGMLITYLREVYPDALTHADALDIGFSVTDDEVATYTNATGAAQDLIIEVDVFDGGTCNDYDLIVTGASDGVLGNPFCNPGIANTTGAVAIAGYEGSLSVAANDATLTVSQAPPFQFGIFVTSTTLVAPLPVAAGQLCLAGDIGRYQFAGQIYGVDMMGNAALAIDRTQIPSTGPLLSAMAGETRGFQGWFRDTGPNGANFSEGVSVTFTP